MSCVSIYLCVYQKTHTAGVLAEIDAQRKLETRDGRKTIGEPAAPLTAKEGGSRIDGFSSQFALLVVALCACRTYAQVEEGSKSGEQGTSGTTEYVS